MMEESEKIFAKWLDRDNFYYIYVEQSVDTFSKRFESESVKRPDFLVGIPDIAIIAIDIKDKQNPYLDKYDDKVPLDKNDVDRAIGFERVFHIPFWYAITSIEKFRGHKWYFISARKVQEYEHFGKKKNAKDRYYAIPLTAFIPLDRDNDTLEKIFVNR